VDDLEARDSLAESKPLRPERIVGNNDDDVHVGDILREAAYRRTAEQDHAHQQCPVLRARLHERIDVGLDASWKPNARSWISDPSHCNPQGACELNAALATCPQGDPGVRVRV
jgi:hypothetical protein